MDLSYDFVGHNLQTYDRVVFKKNYQNERL